MQLEIIKQPFACRIYGYSGLAVHGDYTAKGFYLMNRLWETMRQSNLPNKGQNIWVYEPKDRMFAGVEILSECNVLLERKDIYLPKYAYYKHIGPFHLLKTVGQLMQTEIKNRGYKPGDVYVEMYGHWNKDEEKLETELIVELKS